MDAEKGASGEKNVSSLFDQAYKSAGIGQAINCEDKATNKASGEKNVSSVFDQAYKSSGIGQAINCEDQATIKASLLPMPIPMPYARAGNGMSESEKSITSLIDSTYKSMGIGQPVNCEDRSLSCVYGDEDDHPNDMRDRFFARLEQSRRREEERMKKEEENKSEKSDKESDK